MRLELVFIRITDICFGAETSIENHMLSIDRQQLIALLEQERSSIASKSNLLALENPVASCACSMCLNRVIDSMDQTFPARSMAPDLSATAIRAH